MDGGAGADRLIERGGFYYDLTDGGLFHSRDSDSDYTMEVDLPEATGAGDSFRLTLTRPDGQELTTAALDFDATAAEVETALLQLQQIERDHAEITVTHDANTGSISKITVALGGAYGGRDAGFNLVAGGTQTPSGGSSTPFTQSATLGSGTRVAGRETVDGIEVAEFDLAPEVAGWADVGSFSGRVILTGSSGDDTVILGADHFADLGAGDDRVVLTDAGGYDANDPGVVGGAGFDRLTTQGQSTQTLTDTQISFGSGAAVGHEGIEEVFLIGTAGADTLDASGFAGAELTTDTAIDTLNRGMGLPIRSGTFENIDVTVDGSDTDAFARGYPELKAIHPDDTVSFVDIPGSAETVQDLIAAFEAVDGLTAEITNGALEITSERAGSGDLRFEGVEVTADGTGSGNAATWIDSAMVEALGLQGTGSGAKVTAGLGAGAGVYIEGRAGADTITGSPGDDLIVAGVGEDTVTGGAGRDHLLLTKTGLAGDITATTTGSSTTIDDGDATTYAASVQGIETLEIRGDSAGQTLDATTLDIDLLYRTGGGADTIDLNDGTNADRVIVEGLAGLSADDVTINDAEARDTIYLDAEGALTSDDFNTVNAGTAATTVVGSTPARAEAAMATGVDDSATTTLDLSEELDLGSGTYRFTGESITVANDVTQTGADSALVFETTDFSLHRGATISTAGDVSFLARAEDRRFTSGFYNIQALDIDYRFGVDGTSGTAVVDAENIEIDLRAGKLPQLASGDTSLGDRIGNTFDGAVDTIVGIAELLTGFVAVSRVASGISLEATEHSKFSATGDMTVRAVAETAQKASPLVSVIAAVGVGLVDSSIDIDIESDLQIDGDFDLRSALDSSSVVSAEPEAFKGAAVALGVNVVLLSNEVTVDPLSGSDIGGDLRVAVNTVERTNTSVTATSDEGGTVGLAFGVEVATNTTTARLASEGLTVGGNVFVQAQSSKGSVQKKFARLMDSTSSSSMSTTAGAGTVSGSAVIEDALSSAASPEKGTKDVVKAKAGTVKKDTGNKLSSSQRDGKLGDAKRWLGKKLGGKPEGTPLEESDPGPAAGPKLQLGGAVGVVVDLDTVEATVGYDDGSASEITAGGSVDVIGGAAVRPKMFAVSLVSNEGADDSGSSKIAGSLALNVGVYRIDAAARIEANTTLRARDAVTVEAASRNRIDPNGLWGANLITPFIDLAQGPDHRYADGTVDVSAGDIVEAEDGTLYKAKPAVAGEVDLQSEDFEDTDFWTPVDVKDMGLGLIPTLNTYLNDNFGLKGNLFDFWAQSFARGEKAGIALSSNVLDVDYDARASVGDGATITITDDGTPSGTAQDGDDLIVTAKADQHTLGLAGNFAPFGLTLGGDGDKPRKDKGVYVATKDSYRKLLKDTKSLKFFQNPLGEGDTAVSLGAAVGVSMERTSAIAELGDVTVKAHDLTLLAETSHIGASIDAAGGKAGKLALNGSWSHTSLASTARASIGSGSDIDLAGALDVDAADSVILLRFAGAVSVSDTAAAGLSGVTVFTQRDSVAEVADTGSAGTITAAESVSFDARSSGPVIAGAIAGAVAAPSPDAPESPGGSGSSGGSGSGGGGNGSALPGSESAGGGALDSASQSDTGGKKSKKGVDKGAAKSKAGVAVSGSAIGLRERGETVARIEGLERLDAASVELDARDEALKVLVAGAGSAAIASKTSVAVAGAVTVVDRDRDISAFLRSGSTGMTVDTSGALTLGARDRSGNYAFAAGVSVATGKVGVAASGSVVVAVSRTDVGAGIVGRDDARITLAGTPDVSVSAANEAVWFNLAGAAAFGTTAGVGVSVVVAAIDSVVETTMAHVTGAGLDALKVAALNDVTLNSVAFGVAAAAGKGGAGVGMVAVNDYRASTHARVHDAALTVSGTGDPLVVSATEAGYLGAGAGGAAASTGSAAVGVAVAVNVTGESQTAAGVSRGTEVSVTESTLAATNVPLALLATTDLTLVTVAVGAAAASKVAIAGSAAANRAAIGTRITVGENSVIDAGDKADIAATDSSGFVAVGGGVSLSGKAAGGAGIALNLIETPIDIDMNGTLEADGAAAILGRAEQSLVTVAIGGAGSGNFALGGSIAVTELTGDVSVEVAPEDDSTWTVGDLDVSAIETSSIVSVAGAAGVAINGGGVGLATGTILNTRSVTATMDSAFTLAASGTVTLGAGARAPSGGTENDYLAEAVGALPADLFAETDLTEDSLKTQSTNITASVGGGKMVGVGLNVAYTEVRRDIAATLRGGARVDLLTQDASLTVTADDKSAITNVSVGAAAAAGQGPVALAIAGSVALADIASDVAATVGDATIMLDDQSDLAVAALNEASILSVGVGASLALGLSSSGGAGAVGFSAGVNSITSATGARLGGIVTATGGANSLDVTADNKTSITSISLAAAIAGTGGQIGFAGGGAGSGNTIAGATYAVADGVTVSGVGDMTVRAESEADIHAIVASLAVAVTLGKAGGGVALGVAVADNQTTGGADPIEGLPDDAGFVVAARVVDSDIDLDGALAVTAESTQSIRADVVAASVAVAGAASFGLGAAGAGAVALNDGEAEVLAEVVADSGEDRLHAGSVEVSALNLSEIYAGVGSASVAVGVAGKVGIAVSVGVALAHNRMDAVTAARVDGFAADKLDVGGRLAVEAATQSDDGMQQLEITSTSVAASIAVGGGVAVGLAIAGAGADARNTIRGETTAEITDVAAGEAGSLTVAATNAAKIDADVVAAAAAVGVGGKGPGIAASIGAVFVSNRIGTESDSFDVTARLRDAQLDVADAATLTAETDSEITASGGAGAGAVSVSGTVAASLSGAGADVRNYIYTDTAVAVERTAAGPGGTMLTTGSLTVSATDTSEATLTSAGASVAVAVGAAGGAASLSIGVALGRNTLATSASVAFSDVSLANPLVDVRGTLDADADNTATASTTAVAASVAASAGFGGSIAVSGAGGDADNIIGNTSEVVVTDAHLDAGEDLLLDARSDTTSTSAVVSAAVAAAVGLGAGSNTFGLTFTESRIGGDDAADRDHVTRVHAVGAILEAGDDLRLEADATAAHHISVAAASVAIALGTGGSVAVAGIGAEVSNAGTVEAIAKDSTLDAGGDVTVRAVSETTVDDVVPDVADDTMIGVATSVGLTSIAISVAVLDVEVGNAVRAQVLGARGAAEDPVVSAGGDVDIAAEATTEMLDLNGVGVTLAAGGIAASGGGLEITLDADNTVTAEIDLDDRDRSVEALAGTVTVDAAETVVMESDIANVSVAAAPIGLAIGAAVMRSTHASTVTAAIRDAGVTARSVEALAESDLNLDRVDSTGVSVGTVAAVVNKSTGQAFGTVNTVLDNAKIVAEGRARFDALYDVYLRASTTGVSAGLGAVGAMHSFADVGRAGVRESQVVFTGETRVQAEQLVVRARLDADVFGKTTAGGGGGLSVTGAITDIDENATADVHVASGTTLRAGGISIAAQADRFVDGAADAYSIAVASGSGAKLRLDAHGDATVRFDTATSGARTLVEGRAVSIDTLNSVNKEATVSKNGGGTLVDHNVTTGAGGLAGVRVIGTDAKIGKEGDKSTSQVALGNARIVGQGSYQAPSSVALRALTTHSVADTNEMHAVDGVAGIAAATTDQSINALTNVAMDGAEIDNIAGDVTIATRANMRNTADAGIFQTGALTANLGINVQTDTTSETSVDISDGRILGKSVDITAGKANGTVNSLVARTAANGSIASLGPSLGVALQKNASNRISEIDIDGATEILSAGNIFLEAQKGLLQEGHDGTVLVLAVPPYGYNVGNDGDHQSTRDVDIEASAKLRAGVNYETVYRVEYADDAFLQGDMNGAFDPGDAARALTEAEKENLSLAATRDFVISWITPDDLRVDMFTGDVVQLDSDNADTATGDAGAYYRFVGGADGAAVPIALHKADYTDRALWQRIAPTDRQKADAFSSDTTNFLREPQGDRAKAFLEDQFAVVRPASVPDPTVSVGRLAILLAEQYQNVRDWIREYDTNEEALVRFQAQLDQIERQLLDLGAVEVDDQGNPRLDDSGLPIINESVRTLFLEIPDIVAAPGSIFIESDGGLGRFDGLASGDDPTLRAHKDVSIEISSDALMQHRVGDVVIENTKVARFSEFTGDYTEFYPGNIYVDDGLLVGNASDSQADPQAQINILVDTGNRSDYDYLSDMEAYYARSDTEARQVPSLPPDLYLLGSVVNDLGNITITNSKAGIRVSGQILGETVNISSGGDFTVTTDWYHSGANPRTYDGPEDFAFDLEPNNGNSEIGDRAYGYRTADSDSQYIDDLEDAREQVANQSAVVANGIVSIVANHVNVNGLIQSGLEAASLTIAEDFEPPEFSTSIVDNSDEDNPTGIAGISFGGVNNTQVPLTGRWDAAEQAVVLDEIDFAGGRIEITGNVFSTGAGKLAVASGYPSVNIRNNSEHDVILNGIDTSRDRKGVIQITDTLDKPDSWAARRTVFTQTDAGVERTELRGEVARDPNTGAFQGIEFTERGTLSDTRTDAFAPKDGSFYVWTNGQRFVEQTIELYRDKTFNFIIDWDAGQENLVDETTTSTDPRPLVENEGLDTLDGLQDLNWGFDFSQFTSDSLPDDAEIFARFKNVSNTKVELVNADVVKGPDGTYWEYDDTGPLEIELSDLFDGDDLKSQYEDSFSSLSGDFNETDADKGEYLWNFKNFTETSRSWTEGGGYLKKKTQNLEITRTEGAKKYWDIGVRADKDIAIDFLTPDSDPEVRIESVGDVTFAGDVRTAPEAKVFLNPQFALPGQGKAVNGGSLIAERGVSITGELQRVDTDGEVQLTLVNLVPDGAAGETETCALDAPDTARVLDVRATGDIDIRVGSSTNLDGSAAVRALESTGGNVVLRAPQGIYAEDGAARVSGDRVELQASQARVGSPTQTLHIDTDASAVGGGFSAAAECGVDVTEVAGDMHLVAPESIRTDFIREDDKGPLSVGTKTGVVRLTAAQGNILDYNFENDGTLTAARLDAYKESLGLGEGVRTLIGMELDAESESAYTLFKDYRRLIREPLGDGPVDADLETLRSFQDLVANAAAAPDVTEAEARASLLDRYQDVHAANYDKTLDGPIIDDALYQRYFAVIGTSAEGSSLTSLSSFKAEVDRQFSAEVDDRISQRYGQLHGLLAGEDVSAGTDLRTYVEDHHGNATVKPAITGVSQGVQGWHDLLWRFDNAVLTGYIDAVRASTPTTAPSSSPGIFDSAVEVMAAAVAAGDATYDAALPGFDTAAERQAIEDDLEYRFGDLHEQIRGESQKPRYVETLFLDGASRETAIDQRLAQSYGSIEGALTAGVAKALYPLLEVGPVVGGLSAAAENANIIAPDVELSAVGDKDAGEGRVGTLTEPVEIDFTVDLDSLPDNERLAQENLRRALQVQDITDTVYQLWVRENSDFTGGAQPSTEALEADSDWRKLDVTFANLADPADVTVAPGEAIAIRAAWPGSGGEPEYTYRIFVNEGGGAQTVSPEEVNWDALDGSPWAEVTDTIRSFANDPANLTVAEDGILADVSSVLRVAARPFADVNLRATANGATTTLTMESDGMAGIGHDGARLDVARAFSGGFLRIVTTGDLRDVARGAYAATAEDYISLVSDGAIGRSDSAFRISATGDATLLLQASFDAFVEQVASNALTVENALTGGALDITAPDDLSLGVLEAGQGMTLDVGGDVRDAAADDADPSKDLVARSLTLDVDGAMGAADNRIEVDVTTGTEGAVNGALWLDDFDVFALASGADLTVSGLADIRARQSLTGQPDATLVASDITLRARLGDIGTQSTGFDVRVTGGVLAAVAANDAWITSAAAVPLQRLQAGDEAVLSAAGAITNPRSDDKANVAAATARLSAVTIGTAATPLVTEVDTLALRTGTGAAFARELDDLRLDEAWFDGLAADLAGDARIEALGDLTIEEGLRADGHTVTLRAHDVLRFAGDAARLEAGDAVLAAGNRARFDAGSTIDAAQTLRITADDPSRFSGDPSGGEIVHFGTWRAASVALQTFGDRDTVRLEPAHIDGNVTVNLGDEEDRFTLTDLNARQPQEGFVVDGAGAADDFIVNRAESAVPYEITFADSGAPDDGADILTINARDGADDTVLVRKNFVALLNPEADGEPFERINYGADMNGRVRVNTAGGDDAVYSDDTGTIFTLDVGAGDDLVQIGQVFGADRVEPNVAPGDEIETNETTRGFLSVGTSAPMVVFGGLGEDQINVYSNKAVTKLFGEAGNDNFLVRAFVLADEPEKQAGGGDTEVFGGGGNDNVRYNINAPLAIDGGAGNDTIQVIGTEVADNFVITEEAIYGAGLNIGFEGVEQAEIDGLQGDDTFFVLSTDKDMTVTVIGGLGSDTIRVAGDVTEEIVALEVEGTSGVVNHSVISDDPAYDEIYVRGLRPNIATGDTALFEVDTSGLSALDEGGVAGSYRIRMTEAVTSPVFLTVSAARSSSEDRARPVAGTAQSAEVSLDATGGFAASRVLRFENTTDWQTVHVKAPDDAAAEGTRDVVISHAATGTERAADARIANTEVTVFDDDKPALQIAGAPSILRVVEGGSTAAIDLTLSREPEPDETVTVTLSEPSGDLSFSRDKITFGDGGVAWNSPQTVTLTAVDDTDIENRERTTVSFDVASDQADGAYAAADTPEVEVSIADNDKGEVLVTETGTGTIVTPGDPDSYDLVLTKAPTKDVVVSVLTDGQTVASSTDSRFDTAEKTVTFSPGDWDQAVTIDLSIGTVVTEPQPTVKIDAQPQTLSRIQGPLFLYGGTGPGADRTLEPGVTLPTEQDTALPEIDVDTDETQQTDRLELVNAGDATGQSGRLTEDRLTGFDMRETPLTLEGQDFDAGVTYEAFEVVEVMLGSGDDTLDIASTAAGVITAVHGGGGDDSIRLEAGAEAGGDDRVLAIFGDTTQSGDRYTARTDDLNGTGRVFAAGGDDVIDAEGATGFVMAYGGIGNDTITGSQHDDHLLGGSGDDVIDGLGGRDHVYGDSGLNIDLSVRSDLQDQLIRIVQAQDPGAAGFEAQTGDVLAAPGDDAITAAEGNVILADFGVIAQAQGVNRAFDTGSVTRVSTVRENEGGDDTVTGGAQADWILAGAGADVVDGTAGDDVILGDVGRLTTQGDMRRVVAETSRDAPAVGGDDTIKAGDGLQWVLGGAGGDKVTLGDGGAIVMGDTGVMEAAVSGAPLRVETRESAVGGADTITAGDGAAVVFGGRDGDVIATAGGDDVILGDVGRLDFEGGLRATLDAPIESPSYGGDDSVASGAGDDWIALGAGDDVSESQAGLNIVLGDAGRIVGDPAGVYLRAESLQPRQGGDDRMIGGTGRDVQIGGAGEDRLDGRAGDDLLSGDGALLRRDPAASDLVTFESRDIRAGGDDTLIGGPGLDVLFGGIGSDIFDLTIGEDVVAGEFSRVRLQPDASGKETVTSFLTPAVRDIDLLAQITLGVNFASARSEVAEVGRPLSLDLSTMENERLDVLLDDLAPARAETLMDMVSAMGPPDEPVPGLLGFTYLSEEPPFTAAPEPQTGDDAQQPAQQTQDGAPDAQPTPEPEDAEAQPDGGEQAALPPAGRNAAPGPDASGALTDGADGAAGWRMTGWAIRPTAVA